jgi:hypothetical protein
MLRDIMEFDTNTRFDALVLRCHAADFEHGAHLSKTAGRGKSGLPKYVLIVKDANAGAADLRALMHFSFEWDYRSFIRAWSLQEAIEIANQRLEKYLAKKGQVTV